MTRRPTLLIDWCYFFAVGHVIEALKIAHGYVAANPGLEVHLLLPEQSPLELARACPKIHRVYGIDALAIERQGDAAIALACMPREWDYILDFDWPNGPPNGMQALAAIMQKRFVARRWRGPAATRYQPPPEALLYELDQPIDLLLPEDAHFESPIARHAGPKVVLLLAGGGGAGAYPSLAWWRKACAAIKDALPNVMFAVTGTSMSAKKRTFTGTFPRPKIQALFDDHPTMVDGYDIDLWRQLGLISSCDMLISPHTGFSFLAPIVGTPWLAVSGGNWSEYLLNGVKFFSVLPDCERYPCPPTGMKPECKTKYGGADHYACMTDAALDTKIEDLVAGVKKLLDPAFDYRAAVNEQFAKIDRGKNNTQNFGYFDWWAYER